MGEIFNVLFDTFHFATFTSLTPFMKCKHLHEAKLSYNKDMGKSVKREWTTAFVPKYFGATATFCLLLVVNFYLTFICLAVNVISYLMFRHALPIMTCSLKKKLGTARGARYLFFFYMYKKILEDSSNAASISFAVNTDARYFEIVAKVPNFFDGAVFKSERPTNIFKYLRG